MATSKFLRTFRTIQGVPITTATIWLVPQANTYPTGALALTAHGTRDGQYYRDNVPDGEYKIYIDPAGGSSPTLYEEEIWIGEARITTISDHFDSADSYKLKTTGIKNLAITAAHLASDAVETAKIKDLNVTNAKIANATMLPAKLAQQTVTVVSTTSPTPSYIGQQGRDANGKTYVSIALSGTMWEETPKINSVDLVKSENGIVGFSTRRDKELKFAKRLIGENWSSKKDLLSRASKNYNSISGINSGVGLLNLSGTGSTQTNVAYDGSNIFSKDEIAYVKRVSVPNSISSVVITGDSLTFTYATFNGAAYGVWARKSQLLNLQPTLQNLVEFECYELGGTFRNYAVGLKSSDFQVGFESEIDVLGNKGYFRILAEYGDWLFFSFSLPTIYDTGTTYVRTRFKLINNGNSAAVEVDFMNPVVVIGTHKISMDFIYPESSAEIYLYNGKYQSVKKEMIDPSNLNSSGLLKQEADKTFSLDRYNSSLISQIKQTGEYSLFLKNLDDQSFRLNGIIQPSEDNFVPLALKFQPGDSESWEDNDGTLPYESYLVPKFYRYNYNYANGSNTQITLNSILPNASSADYDRMWFFWIRKTSIENLPSSLRVLMGGVEFLYLKENLLRVGYSQSNVNGSYTADLEVICEFNGWMCYKILANYGSNKFLLLKVGTTAGQSGVLDICNISCLHNIVDADPTKIYYNDAFNYIDKNYIQQQKTQYNKGLANDLIAKAKLVGETIIYNKFKQPDFSGASAQFPVNPSGMTIELVAHDGTLPFKSSELPSFYRMTYDCSFSSQQISSTVAGSPTKYTIFLWLRKSDVEALPGELRFYIQGQDWHGILKDNLVKIGYEKTYSDATYNFSMKVVAEFNGWIAIKADFEKLSGTFAAYYFFMLVQDPSAPAGTGKLDFCNACLIPDTFDVNIFEVYYHNGDTRTPPTFDNKVLKALAASDVWVEEVENALINNPEILANQIVTEVTKYSFGANIQNFLRKARDYKGSRFASKAPTVVIIGDSISSYSEANNSWTWYLKNLLVTKYGIPEENILPIHWYGGASTNYLLPFIEDTLIYPNPDLIVWAEFESSGTSDEFFKKIEQIIQLIRLRTTADICITTWGSSYLTEIYNSGTPYTWDQISEMNEQKYFNWYRDLARKYNCELIDHNQALIEWVLEGNDPSTIYAGVPHVNSAGFSIYNEETLKHFYDTSWQKRMNQPNVLHDVENLIHLSRDFVWTAFANMQKEISFGNKANWTVENTYLYIESTTNGEFILIDFYGIGLEIFYSNNSATHSLTISDDDGSTYINPSAVRVNSKPLEYCSEVISITYASNWDTWRLKRPAMHIEVLDNILANGTFISGQYKIKVINIVENGASPDTVTCEIFDPSATSLGTFNVGDAFTFASGKLRIPQTWNGQNNYYNSAAYSNWVLDEEFEFYIKSNWLDTFTTSPTGSVRLIGLENKRHLVKITKTNTVASRFTYVRIFNPIEGRG